MNVEDRVFDKKIYLFCFLNYFFKEKLVLNYDKIIFKFI